jgi:hypothetical protein
MKEELEKNKNELALSTAISSRLAVERVEKFVNSPLHLLERYNPDCWIKAYQNQQKIFKPETSPILKDVALAYGEEVVIDMIGIHIGKFAKRNYIKVPDEENYSVTLAKMIYEGMQNFSCGELMLFFEMLQRNQLANISHCLAYSEIHNAVKAYGKYHYDIVNKIEQQSGEDKERIRYIRIYNLLKANMPLGHLDGFNRYGMAYTNACDIIIKIIMNTTYKAGQNIETWSDEYIRKVCLDCWGKFIIENENNELFYQGKKL